MDKQAKSVDVAELQSIEALQGRYNKLNTRKIQAETNLENARRQLEQLKQEAREKYGTDDVTALRAKLAELSAENELKRKNYQAQLDRIEGELEAVELKFADAESTGHDRTERAG
jgi:hypothetical protein